MEFAILAVKAKFRNFGAVAFKFSDGATQMMHPPEICLIEESKEHQPFQYPDSIFWIGV